VLAAIAAVFGSTERQAQKHSEVIVDENHADVDSTRNAKGTLRVVRVKPREQTVLG
jgi:hypothetical protein